MLKGTYTLFNKAFLIKEYRKAIMDDNYEPPPIIEDFIRNSQISNAQDPFYVPDFKDVYERIFPNYAEQTIKEIEKQLDQRKDIANKVIIDEIEQYGIRFLRWVKSNKPKDKSYIEFIVQKLYDYYAGNENQSKSVKDINTFLEEIEDRKNGKLKKEDEDDVIPF